MAGTEADLEPRREEDPMHGWAGARMGDGTMADDVDHVGEPDMSPGEVPTTDVEETLSASAPSSPREGLHIAVARSRDPRRSVAALHQTFRSGRTRSLGWRRSQLKAMTRMLRENAGTICRAIHADLGKPAAEAMLMEIDLVLEEIRFILPRLGRWTARRPVPMHWLLQPAAGWTVAEPKGVALVISPWNYPVLLSLEPMADAIAAGNCVCLKPSELSPRTSAVLSELVKRYLDPRAFAVIQGGPDVATEVLAQPFDHVFYTGSGRVGSIVMAAAARRLTSVTLELGGKSPVFVDGSADLEVAARRIAWGRFINAGQTCVAPDYVLVTPD
ncbi:aldehyde dehydrogenase family protein, partial [uncultured Bifidobacterium sp.]|uniref:aldehyde dehydrogenase family protein n=1 Tax=uncultured Bifidobacterium sp. TaxID=165187 RepID=UPI0028DB29AB